MERIWGAKLLAVIRMALSALQAGPAKTDSGHCREQSVLTHLHSFGDHEAAWFLIYPLWCEKHIVEMQNDAGFLQLHAAY